MRREIGYARPNSVIQLISARCRKINKIVQEQEFDDFMSAHMEKIKIYAPHYTAYRLQKPLETCVTPEKGMRQDVFNEVEELYFSGGGGGGRAFPQAVVSACEYGLDLKKVKLVCGTSVGSMMAIALALEVPANSLGEVLSSMPTDTFQDWSTWHILTQFQTTWGLCKGEEMPLFFRNFIKKWTGLEDPTFKELYDAGYEKKLVVVTTNLTEGKIGIFSFDHTPFSKVADIVALSCAVPFVFPPKRIMMPNGKMELHTDGGVIQNYPWGIGSQGQRDANKRLGFSLVNSLVGDALSNVKKANPIDSLPDYLYRLLHVIIFQQPLGLSEEAQEHTVAIHIRHNPMDFTPSPEQQVILEKAAQEGIDQLAERLMLKQQQNRQRC